MLNFPANIDNLSETNYKNVWLDVKAKYTRENTWVIEEELQDQNYSTMINRLLQTKRVFKGIFQLMDFPNHLKSEYHKFIMTRGDIPISQIKKEIGKITKVAPEQISISYAGYVPLADSDDFEYTLNRSGSGGEVFYVRFKN
jgi:hypothetical protein